VLAGVARRLAKSGQTDQALQVAAGIEDPGERAWALAGVARRLAKSGQTDQALQVASGIEKPWHLMALTEDPQGCSLKVPTWLTLSLLRLAMCCHGSCRRVAAVP